MYRTAIIAAVALIFLAGCRKDADGGGNQQVFAPLSLEFDNIAGGQNLILNSNSKYTNASGEEFNITLLQYFISNIKLKKADGTEYVVPQDSSYFLIREGEDDDRFANMKVPEGDYVSLSFIVGVDSLRSTMDISKRTGVLDPSGSHDDGMYWGWNSGYIFFKMEGLSDAAPLDPGGQHKFRYHIGGFGGYDAPTINNIRAVTLDLNERGIAKVRSPQGTNVHLMVDVLKMFSGVNTVSIAQNPTVMFSAYSTNIADNLPGMFRHDHTEN